MNLPHASNACAGALEEFIFETALGLEDPDLLDSYLNRWFQGDPEGLHRMKSLLLASRQSAGYFLEAGEERQLLAGHALALLPGDLTLLRPSRPEPELLDGPGARIGNYRLLKRIGEGGCGVVFEAEQDHPVQRRVALKVIRLGMDTEAVVARFAIERQALALMDHRNIASVLDAGATDAGRPYFVMELVEGEPITTYCASRLPGIRPRLELFVQVCWAIEHAHQKGIVHRDIKPSNILIKTQEEGAVPKVIDFGIAKAVSGPLGGQTMATGWDQMIGTPSYMSPEQVDLRGIDIDTRSDIYSLGALLYELLAGVPPFDGDTLARMGVSSMRRTLLECNPPPPSLAARTSRTPAGRPRIEPSRRSSPLKGDLDSIVMMAMEKDRNRRYQTVGQLARDVERFLANEPVIARRSGRLYHFGKLVKRNKPTFVLSALLTLSLLAGLGLSTRLYLREKRALAEQERLSRQVADALARESQKRSQSDLRADLARAALLLGEDRVPEADELLRKAPPESIEPGPENSQAFRALGTWNALHHRWDQAARYFLLLHRADLQRKPADVLRSIDVVAIAPCLLEYRDLPSYQTFRTDILSRYAPAADGQSAHMLLKASLLLPSDAPLPAEYSHWAAVCDANYQQAPHSGMRQLEGFSLALFHYRSGKLAKALEMAQAVSAASHRFHPLHAASLVLAAMAKQQLGETEAAREDLSNAAQCITPSSHHHASGTPNAGQEIFWWDWAVARILYREASSLIGL